MEGTELTPQQIPINIEDEMRKSYMDYAMSVIVGRALPDIRDGLKPAHRRILYAMYDLGNIWNKPFKKSARIVGDVIGKYHPHGDTAVYDTLVRMAQYFSLRYPLVDGQGNFGSQDGDPPAAMRYTEVRMSEITSEMLADIEKETIDFVANYDGTLREPSILPAKIPNLLVNGSSGIAVGMATNIPPHNLKEIIDAVIALIKKPTMSIEDLIAMIPGPDFPTAGFIYGREGIRDAYRTGRGILQLRAKAFIEKKEKGNREWIIISELPYQVNKARLVERIAELVQEKKIEGISDLRDESDREGMRVVIELKRDKIAKVVLNQLFQRTQMQITFGIIMLALVDNQPRVLTLKEQLKHFIDYRKLVILRRTAFELKKAENRAHILEGLKIAIDNLDKIIALIRSSANPGVAREGLMKKFKLSEAQAQAILEMRLQRLTALERGKIEEELKETIELIKSLKAILDKEALVQEIIIEELTKIRAKYGDERKTEIIDKEADINIEDMIIKEDMVVTVTHNGYIKRNPISLYRSQRRGGKGVTGITTKQEDFVEHLFVGSTLSHILFFTNTGKVFWQKVYEIPQAGRAAMGKAIVNLLHLSAEEKIAAIMPVRAFEEGSYVVMATRKGLIKKTPLMAYSRPRVGGIIALGIDKGDELIAARVTDGNQEILLGSKKGKAIRFKEKEARPMGRTARGVRGVMVGKDDEVIGMESIGEGATILTVTENGFGKRTNTAEYRIQARRGRGIITIRTSARNGNVIGMKQVTDDDEIMLITNYGKIIRTKIKGISVIGRNTQGVKLINVEKDEKVVGIAHLAEKE
ncbi:MAG: DNA gyrase subunit A [Deltaproteobacteria bacterium]|jgi:DNA gyrase subunit A|nr:DNA gyrase subunit A [Deltaproteobacteria bacterium]MBW1853624.1 DNA gyrase subunit A [Deltaproteobacteria bacterium]MBW2182273.1 DNA gyrase subunit A [Deltaproteobacteria bacterium]